jgi:transcriptional regulator with XRE-family HTH domain
MTEHPLEQWLKQKKEAGQPVRKRELAADAKCSPSRITQILKGDEPSLALAARLSKATDIPIDSFVKQDAE